jgi:glutamate--cysteine ligase
VTGVQTCALPIWPHGRICALPAFWVGLLYEDSALDAAWDLVKHWTIEDHQRIRDEVPKLGLKARGPRGRSLLELAGIVLDIAASGLKARARLNCAGDDETGYLAPLREIVARGKSPAEQLLDLYHGAWAGDVSRVYEDARF